MDELPNAVYQALPLAFPSVHMTRSRIPMKHVVPVRILVPKVMEWFWKALNMVFSLNKRRQKGTSRNRDYTRERGEKGAK